MTGGAGLFSTSTPRSEPQWMPITPGLKDELARIPSEALSSDFTYGGMYAWDVKGLDRVAAADGGGLAFKLHDYLDGAPFYTCVGTGHVTPLLEQLLETANTDRAGDAARLITEGTLGSDWAKVAAQFQVTEDRDNFDYLYSVTDLINMPGRRFHGKRNSVRRCLASGELQVCSPDPSNPEVVSAMLELFDRWGQIRGHIDD